MSEKLSDLELGILLGVSFAGGLCNRERLDILRMMDGVPMLAKLVVEGACRDAPSGGAIAESFAELLDLAIKRAGS